MCICNVLASLFGLKVAPATCFLLSGRSFHVLLDVLECKTARLCPILLQNMDKIVNTFQLFFKKLGSSKFLPLNANSTTNGKILKVLVEP